MKNYIYLALSALAVCACAKAPSTGANEDAKLYFESWMQVHHPEAVRTKLGAYVLDEVPGTGAAFAEEKDGVYVRVDYVTTSLDGTITGTTLESVSQQLGSYQFGNYYGPVFWYCGEGSLAAGIEEALGTMRVGGSKTFVLPGWLQTLSRYDSAEAYEENVSGGSPAIYEIRLQEIVRDVAQWETDSIAGYIPRSFPGKAAADSLEYGFYYFRTGEPSSDEKLPADTTIYINYIGRLLNGTVFDTNVKDSAKFYGIYSASRSYEPSSITFSTEGEGEDAETTAQMGSSSVIPGFSKILTQMHPHEKGSGVFYSTFGYGSSGSGASIPAYSPLRFDIEIVDKP